MEQTEVEGRARSANDVKKTIPETGREKGESVARKSRVKKIEGTQQLKRKERNVTKNLHRR